MEMPTIQSRRLRQKKVTTGSSRYIYDDTDGTRQQFTVIDWLSEVATVAINPFDFVFIHGMSYKVACPSGFYSPEPIDLLVTEILVS